MAKHFVFPCDVDLAGKPKIAAAFIEQYRCALRLFAGQRCELVLRKPKSQRSLDMNAYLHCDTGPFRRLTEHFEDRSIEEVKYDLMGQFFGWVPGPISGQLVPIKAHSSDMTREESGQFVEWVIPWALLTYGVVIDPPKKAGFDL